MTSVNTGPGGTVDLDNLFTYHPPTPEQVGLYEALRSSGLDLATAIAVMCPPGPDRTKAIGAVREAVMWANASIATGNSPAADENDHEAVVEAVQQAQHRSAGRWARIVEGARQRLAEARGE